MVGFKRAVIEFQEYVVFTPTDLNLAKLDQGTRHATPPRPLPFQW